MYVIIIMSKPKYSVKAQCYTHTHTHTFVDLNVNCTRFAVPGRETIVCGLTNTLVSVSCSFDGGLSENCSFPLVLLIDRFGTVDHNVTITATDVFGQSVTFSFNFSIAERKL